jgi:predicted acyltransferase
VLLDQGATGEGRVQLAVQAEALEAPHEAGEKRRHDALLGAVLAERGVFHRELGVVERHAAAGLIAHREVLRKPNLPSYIDRLLLGDSHLLRATPYESQLDPEGLLSTLPAMVNVLAGVFCARWLNEQLRDTRTSVRLFGLGALVVVAGWSWSALFPINKALWTSSFVLVSSGLAAMALALCFELVDVRSRAGWLKLCEVLGLNAIAAYLLSTWIDIGATEFSLPLFADEDTPYVWLRTHVLDAIPAPDASLLFALAEILLVSIVMYGFYRRSWFLRI